MRHVDRMHHSPCQERSRRLRQDWRSVPAPSAQPRALSTPHAGACVALELAMAHGFLDEAKKRIVMRTLTDPRNPYADRFGTSTAALNQTCALVFAHRWSP